MASKFMVFHMLLAMAMLAVELESAGALPTIQFIDAVAVSGKNPPPIELQIKAGGSVKGSAQLQAGKGYQVIVDVYEIYYASAVFGSKFTAFHAYEPARDGDLTAVYWKADDQGFTISYDKLNWKRAAYWESE